MKPRLGYLIAAAVLLAVEIWIGMYVCDAFIRPYGGDILVAVLLCCLWRCVFPKGSPRMPVYMFLFCAAVEAVQLLELPRRLGIEGTVLGILMGSSFSWLDLLCYGAGCVLFAVAERWIRH